MVNFHGIEKLPDDDSAKDAFDRVLDNWAIVFVSTCGDHSSVIFRGPKFSIMMCSCGAAFSIEASATDAGIALMLKAHAERPGAIMVVL